MRIFCNGVSDYSLNNNNDEKNVFKKSSSFSNLFSLDTTASPNLQIFNKLCRQK